MVATLLLPDGGMWPLVPDARIGRGTGCALQLTEHSVSREHVAIHETAGRWYVEDLGSRNGTFVNDVRVGIGYQCPIRHGDRLTLGATTLVVSIPDESDDDERTSSLELVLPDAGRALSPYQLQVVRALAAPWLETGGEPATNAEIAAAVGTPNAVEAVKAALRRAYAKAGLADAPAHGKRRALCRAAREHGWV